MNKISNYDITPKEMFNSANTKIQEFIKPINSEFLLND